ncbi:MAG: HEPN domain-containing protein [Nitrososphaerota archaeon]
MLNEFKYSRWIRAACQALESAKADLSRGEYNWSCFKAEQAAECALKGLLKGLGILYDTHSLTRMLAGLPKDLDSSSITKAVSELDKLFLPTRYPDAWVEGVPSNYYTRQNARAAISYAMMIIKWVEDAWSSLKRQERRITGT